MDFGAATQGEPVKKSKQSCARNMHRVLWVGLVLLVPTSWAAQQVSLSYLEGLQPQAPDAITALSKSPFGEQINLYNGSLEFAHTDLNVPGNSALPVALHRRHRAGRIFDLEQASQLGDWELDVPRMAGTYFSAGGWTTAANTGARCSQWGAPPSIMRSASTGEVGWLRGTGSNAPPAALAAPESKEAARKGADPQSTTLVSYSPQEYWQGVSLQVPGAGSQVVLRRSGANTLAPNDGSSYPLVTRDNWQIGCLPSLANGSGEGFIAKSPDGLTYRFNWIAARHLVGLKKQGANLPLDEVSLMATEVTDRFGQWVHFTYDPAAPLNLTRIDSSDGRFINLYYTNGRLTSAADGSRTFTYGYASDGRLASVQQPDGSAWTFSLGAMVYPYQSDVFEGANCNNPGGQPPGDLTGTITHPSGATGTFVTRFLFHGRTYVQQACKYVPNSTTISYGAVWPKILSSQTLVSRAVSGPGVGTQTWTYGYQSSNCYSSGAGACTNQSDRKIVTITEPDGTINRHQFGNRWQVNEGQLLELQEGWDGTTALRNTAYRYRGGGSGQCFAAQWGVQPLTTSDELATRNLPQDRRFVTQQNVGFTWEVAQGCAGFDYFSRPLQVSKYSSLGWSKTDSTQYWDQLQSWILSQVASISTNGIVVQSSTYNLNSGLRDSYSEFGLLKQQYDYHANGMLRRVYDPLGRVTLWDNYYRGQARNIIHRDGTQESAVINNLGKPVSHTNAAGTTTGYGYDAMGRLNRIDPPAEAGMAYHPTLDVFEPVQVAEYGIGAGHWRQTTTTGNARTVRYYDGLWRVGLTRTFDAANEPATSRFVEFHYDTDGRKTFASQPQRNLSTIGSGVPGTTWFYDALGRTTAQRQDSELGNLDTVTQYLSGFQRRTTNARGYATTTTFQVFDAPTEDAPTTIWAPEGVTVGLNRDTLGKPTAITRSGGGKSVTRSYVYDGYQRLCKTIEPESGATVQAYDGAGNVQWRASGQGLPGGNCDQGSVPAGSKVSYGYDARDRLVITSYGDGSPGVTRSYWPDGLLQQITTQHPSNPIGWNYSYNNRRLLTRERYTWDNAGGGWNFDWQVDPYGHVSALADPGGTVSYAPNALGEPTQVSGLATGVSYHPNGSIASYTLANGVTHSTALNTRGLPLRITNTGISQDVYAYDATGNITAIIDERENVNSRSMPQYDGLDRLRQANGPWGSGSYDYDALDNLVASTVGGRSLTHNIDAGTNRLTSLSGSQSIGIGYDVNGNVTQRGAQSFSFDIGNRMVNAPGKVNSYVYDGHGRRNLVWFADGSWMHQAYTQDGKLRFGWRNTEGGTRHVYLGDKLIAEIADSGFATFSHTDALGSPIAKTNSGGGLVSRTRYEPYGATVAGSTNPTKIGFTGHVNDPDTGLVYMQQRYYDSIGGRFLSVDPVTTDAATGSLFNRYNYAYNNPYRFKDPDGRFGIAGALVGAGIEALAQWSVTGSVSDLKAVAVAAAVGAITGGVGGYAANAALTGATTAGKAIAATAAVGGAAAAAGKHAEGALKGETVSAKDAGIAAAGGALGAGAGAKLANGAAGTLEKMAASKDGVVAGMAAATRGAITGGGPAQVSSTVGSEAAQKSIDAGVAVGQKIVEEKTK